MSHTKTKFAGRKGKAIHRIHEISHAQACAVGLAECSHPDGQQEHSDLPSVFSVLSVGEYSCVEFSVESIVLELGNSFRFRLR